MDTIEIFLWDGIGLIFDKENAKRLRQRRIVWQLVGRNGSSPALPCMLTRCATRLCLDMKIATFKKICSKNSDSILDYGSIWNSELAELKIQAEKDYVKNRRDELERHNIEPTDSAIGKFDESKVKIPVPLITSRNANDFIIESLDYITVERLLKVDSNKYIVYKDLYMRGFYMTSGTKFGSDYVVYQGDPLLYHGTFAINIVPSTDQNIDWLKLDYTTVNTLQRLCNSVNKIPLFAIIIEDSEANSTIRYWFLKPRRYLDPETYRQSLEIIDPKASVDYYSALTSDRNELKKLRTS